MMSVIARSEKIVRSNPLLVILMACAGLYVTCHSTTAFLGISLATAFVYTPAIYGRFMQLVVGQRPIPLLRLFQRHGFNYYFVVILFFAPLIAAAGFLVRKDHASDFMNIAFAAAQVLLIHVLPLAFMRTSPLDAISSGLTFLVKNALVSLPLIVLALLNPLLHAATPSSWIAFDLSSFRAAVITLPFALLYNLVRAYLGLVLFTAAGVVQAQSAERAGESAGDV